MRSRWWGPIALAIFSCLGSPAQSQQEPVRRISGYHGIWFTLGQPTEQGDKYSGGLGTYTANHVPIAIYSHAAEKTFFTYGGTIPGKRHLLIMVSYYDHRTGCVPRPVVVHDKQGVDDPHDNAAIALDDRGYLWVYVSGRMRIRPGFRYRSRQPLDIEAGFDLVETLEMTYPQPHWVEGIGFVDFFTRYTAGRELYVGIGPPTGSWTRVFKMVGFGGHYQVSMARGRRIGTAFMMHPGGDVDRRTQLYYIETPDGGSTWRTVDGQPLEVPLTSPKNPALIHDYRAEGRLVYINDLAFTADGRPVIFYVISSSWKPGPQPVPREWRVTVWDGEAWRTHTVTTCDHNYDMGSLYILAPDDWRIVGPSEPGPQPDGTGGEMALWRSRDDGRTWTRERFITRDSPRNHSYARRPIPWRDPFFALWADGNPREFSESCLYFCNSDGTEVYRLPTHMEGATTKPELVGSE